MPNLFLASILEQIRKEVLRRYAEELRGIIDSVSCRCDLYELCLNDAGRLLDDIIATSRGGGDAAASHMATATSSAEASPLLDELHPSDLARTGMLSRNGLHHILRSQGRRSGRPHIIVRGNVHAGASRGR